MNVCQRNNDNQKHRRIKKRRIISQRRFYSAYCIDFFL